MDFPLSGGNGYAESAIISTTLNAGGGASGGSYGSWAELSASCPFTTNAIIMMAATPSSQIYAFAYDLGIGGAGSEVAIVTGICHANHINIPSVIPLPIQIPEGARIAVRAKASTGSASFAVRALLVRGGLWQAPAGGRVRCYPSGGAGGTQIDPGAVANTYGSYTELTASTTKASAGILVSILNYTNIAATASTLASYMDIAIGGAGSEVVILSGIPYAMAAAGAFVGPAVWLPADIPAGTRLSARCRSNVTDATDRQVRVQVLTLEL